MNLIKSRSVKCEDGRMLLYWELTMRERFKILLSGVLYHQIKVDKQDLQPTLLSVDESEGYMG